MSTKVSWNEEFKKVYLMNEFFTISHYNSFFSRLVFSLKLVQRLKAPNKQPRVLILGAGCGGGNLRLIKIFFLQNVPDMVLFRSGLGRILFVTSAPLQTETEGSSYPPPYTWLLTGPSKGSLWACGPKKIELEKNTLHLIPYCLH